MKNRIENVLLFALIFLLPNICHASSIFSKKDSLQFQGKIVDLDHQKKPTFLKVQYTKDDWSGTKAMEEMILNIDSAGKFNFNLPNLGKPFMGMIMAFDENKELFFAPIYLPFDVDDSVYFDISRNQGKFSIVFSGKSAEKFKLVSELENDWTNYFGLLAGTGIELGSVGSLNELNDKMSKLTTLVRKFNEIKRKRIESSPVSDVMKDYLFNEYARFSADWFFRLKLMYLEPYSTEKKNVSFRPEMKKYFDEHKQEFLNKEVKSPIVQGLYYQDLLDYHILNTLIKKQVESPSLKDVYEDIKATYTGIIRDRAIHTLLKMELNAGRIAISENSIRDSLTKDAISFIKVPYVKAHLEKINVDLNRVDKAFGKVAFDGNFELEDGKRISVSDLRGKVVLVDGWFTGCSGCAEFHKVFEEKVFPQIKNREKLEVLSINSDLKRQKWIEGLKSKLYSSDNYVNVRAKDGVQDPFFKFYNVTGFSWAMLLDVDGKVCFLPGTASAEEWTREINKAIERADKTK